MTRRHTDTFLTATNAKPRSHTALVVQSRRSKSSHINKFPNYDTPEPLNPQEEAKKARFRTCHQEEITHSLKGQEYHGHHPLTPTPSASQKTKAWTMFHLFLVCGETNPQKFGFAGDHFSLQKGGCLEQQLLLLHRFSSAKTKALGKVLQLSRRDRAIGTTLTRLQPQGPLLEELSSPLPEGSSSALPEETNIQTKESSENLRRIWSAASGLVAGACGCHNLSHITARRTMR